MSMKSFCLCHFTICSFTCFMANIGQPFAENKSCQKSVRGLYYYRSIVQINQLVNDKIQVITELNGASIWTSASFGVKIRACEYNSGRCGKAPPSVPEVWGRFSEHHKVLRFTTAGEPQHDPKRNDTWLCAWRFGQVHAGWFMRASSPRSPGANIDCFFSSQLKANGRQQFLYFESQYKWNLQRCKHSWQGAFFSNQMPDLRKSLIGYYIDLLYLYRLLCAGWTFSQRRCSQTLSRVVLLGMPKFA